MILAQSDGLKKVYLTGLLRSGVSIPAGSVAYELEELYRESFRSPIQDRRVLIVLDQVQPTADFDARQYRSPLSQVVTWT